MTEQSSPAYEGFPATADNPNDGSYDVPPTFPRIEGCPDDVCAATQLCLAAGDCYADQFCEPWRHRAVCPTRTPEVHDLGEFPMTCYRCHVEADS